MTIALIVAHAQNLTIGVDGKLPWHYSEDLKRFKRLTTGHPVVMGRKTYESIGKPLPNRRNMIISRNYSFSGTEVFSSLKGALETLKDEDLVFIIGGASLYKAAIDFADRLYVTLIDKDVDGDTHFPEYRNQIGKVWNETGREDHGEFSFIDYERITIDN